MLTFIRLLFDFPQYHSALNSEHFYKTKVNLYHHIHITARLNWRRFLMSQIPSISPKNRYRKLYCWIWWLVYMILPMKESQWYNFTTKRLDKNTFIVRKGLDEAQSFWTSKMHLFFNRINCNLLRDICIFNCNLVSISNIETFSNNEQCLG